MARRLRKRLPKDFEEIVESGDLAAMKAVFETCELDARGGIWRSPALSFYGVPDELVRWLVAQGADLHAPDEYGETPLHHHASAWNGNPGLLLELGAEVDRRDGRGQTALFGASIHPAHTSTLIAAGADVNALDDEDETPLSYRLRRTSNADIARVAETAAALVAAGTHLDAELRELVRGIGEEFEAARDIFDPDSVEETDAGLRRLYGLFGVEAAPTHVRHDGSSPIQAPAGEVNEQFRALWDLLVPAAGAAATVQGEAIRVAGRVFDEIYRNGGVNWDADYRAMLKALPGYLGLGTPLPDRDLAEVRERVASMRGGDAEADELDRLRQLALEWVLGNPAPIPLGEPPYRR